MSEPTYTAEQTSTCNLGESTAKVKIKVTYMDQKGAKTILNMVALFMQMIAEYPNAQLDLLNEKLNMIGPSKAEREAALAAGAADGTDLADRKKNKKSTDQAEPPKKLAPRKATSKIKKPGAGLPSARNKRKGK